MSGFSTPPEGTTPVAGRYVPGSKPVSESYDLPEGSQAHFNPDHDVAASADSNETLIQHATDPEFAYSSSPLNPEDREFVQLSGTDFDEDDDFIVFASDTTL